MHAGAVTRSQIEHPAALLRRRNARLKTERVSVHAASRHSPRARAAPAVSGDPVRRRSLGRRAPDPSSTSTSIRPACPRGQRLDSIVARRLDLLVRAAGGRRARGELRAPSAAHAPATASPSDSPPARCAPPAPRPAHRRRREGPGAAVAEASSALIARRPTRAQATAAPSGGRALGAAPVAQPPQHALAPVLLEPGVEPADLDAGSGRRRPAAARGSGSRSRSQRIGVAVLDRHLRELQPLPVADPRGAVDRDRHDRRAGLERQAPDPALGLLGELARCASARPRSTS